MAFLKLLLAVVIIFAAGGAGVVPAGGAVAGGVATETLRTDWAAKVSAEEVPLPEYPRPQLQREEWLNLNGQWDYVFAPAAPLEAEFAESAGDDVPAVPAAFCEGNRNEDARTTAGGKILVPFCVESALSGVQKPVGKDKVVWYSRTFSVPKDWAGKNVLLNFGGVDWKCDVFVNGVFVGQHRGGHAPFSFDITKFLKPPAGTKPPANTLVVRVWDPTEAGFQPRGKQTSRPGSIFYTAVTGIWQTVWLEPVAKTHLTRVKCVPDIDAGTLAVTVNVANPTPQTQVKFSLRYKGRRVFVSKFLPNRTSIVRVPNMQLWTPEEPRLYTLKVKVLEGEEEEELDVATTYTAMRKISAARDAAGVMRLQLNNKNYFQLGTLDQGWWPDGLYTAPTDEALLFDIKKTKQLGFNLIRKHTKVEPARWYYHCAREGMLVWQDMPSGDDFGKYERRMRTGGPEVDRTPQSRVNWRQEWREVMTFLASEPAIVVWVPFNEGWGQFETEQVVGQTQRRDPSRLVIPASGGNHRLCGDILALHHYPNPALFLEDKERPVVLSEFGGIGLAVPGHLWNERKNAGNWGYVNTADFTKLTAKYVEFAKELKRLIPRGLCAAVYTQTTDIEAEINGLITYDRKKVKVAEDAVRAVNQEVIGALK